MDESGQTAAEDEQSAYQDVAGFCKSVIALDDDAQGRASVAGGRTPEATIQKHDYVLTPGRYVGAEAEA